MSGQSVFAELPSGYRPKKTIILSIWCTYGGTTGFFGGYINSDGQIRTDIGGGTVNGIVRILPVSFGIIP